MIFPRLRRPADPETFRFPLPWHGRLALVDTDLRGNSDALNFESTDLAAIEAWAPESIVLPLSIAVSYAAQRLAGSNLLPSLRSAIIILSSSTPPGVPMTDDHRDLLWHAFGLPVFEQLLGPDGAVVAHECEVHDGLHAECVSIDPQSAELIVMGQPLGCSAEIVTGHCDCGLETPRLRNLTGLRKQAAA